MRLRIIVSMLLSGFVVFGLLRNMNSPDLIQARIYGAYSGIFISKNSSYPAGPPTERIHVNPPIVMRVDAKDMKEKVVVYKGVSIKIQTNKETFSESDLEFFYNIEKAKESSKGIRIQQLKIQ